MEFVAVIYHARLGRQGRGNSIAGLSGCCCGRSGCWLGGGCACGFPVGFDTVGLVRVEVGAACIEEGVLWDR